MNTWIFQIETMSLGQMKSELQHLAQTWEDLGQGDPLWAVVTHPDKRGGRWEITEFMETGERDVAYYHALIVKHAHSSGTFSHILDFGCGVGRLTRAWSRHAGKVTGVDISASMLQVAKQNLAGRENVNFVLNQDDELRIFEDDSFDFVFSLICLQHMPWPLAANYIGEFARICRRGGIVAFQLPSQARPSSWVAQFPKALVRHLPFGMGRLYRRWRYGSSAAFDMFYTPCDIVEASAATVGLKLTHREPDFSAGLATEGFCYIFRKPE